MGINVGGVTATFDGNAAPLVSAFEQASGAAKRAGEQMGGALKPAVTAADEVVSAYERLKARQGELVGALAAAPPAIAQNKQLMEAYRIALGNTTAQLDALTGRERAHVAATQAVAQAQARASATSALFGQAINGTFKGVGGEIGKVTSMVSSIGGALGGLPPVVQAIGGAISAAFGALALGGPIALAIAGAIALVVLLADKFDLFGSKAAEAAKKAAEELRKVGQEAAAAALKADLAYRAARSGRSVEDQEGSERLRDAQASAASSVGAALPGGTQFQFSQMMSEAGFSMEKFAKDGSAHIDAVTEKAEELWSTTDPEKFSEAATAVATLNAMLSATKTGARTKSVDYDRWEEEAKIGVAIANANAEEVELQARRKAAIEKQKSLVADLEKGWDRVFATAELAAQAAERAAAKKKENDEKKDPQAGLRWVNGTSDVSRVMGGLPTDGDALSGLSMVLGPFGNALSGVAVAAVMQEEKTKDLAAALAHAEGAVDRTAEAARLLAAQHVATANTMRQTVLLDAGAGAVSSALGGGGVDLSMMGGAIGTAIAPGVGTAVGGVIGTATDTLAQALGGAAANALKNEQTDALAGAALPAVIGGAGVVAVISGALFPVLGPLSVALGLLGGYAFMAATAFLALSMTTRSFKEFQSVVTYGFQRLAGPLGLIWHLARPLAGAFLQIIDAVRPLLVLATAFLPVTNVVWISVGALKNFAWWTTYGAQTMARFGHFVLELLNSMGADYDTDDIEDFIDESKESLDEIDAISVQTGDDAFAAALAALNESVNDDVVATEENTAAQERYMRESRNLPLGRKELAGMEFGAAGGVAAAVGGVSVNIERWESSGDLSEDMRNLRRLASSGVVFTPMNRPHVTRRN